MSKTQSPETIEEWFEEGVRCFNKPDGVGAVRAFREVIEQNPTYRHKDGDNPYFYMGKIHEIEGDIDQAIIMYTRALSIQSMDEESLIGRGSCLTVKGEHDRAISDFSKVISIPDQYRRAPVKHLYYAVAENYRLMEDYTEALKWGEKALDADPDNFRHQELVKRVKTLLNGK